MTAQAHETLILDGKKASMMTCPRIPEKHPRISQKFHAGGTGGSFTRSTACWRGYVGTWEIRESMLFLRSVVGAYRIKGDEPLQADWYSGTLRVPRGKMIQYVHMGFGSVYEEELYIKIRRGRVIKTSLRSRSPGNTALKSLSNLPLIGKFFGEESFLGRVVFRKGRFWLLLVIGFFSASFVMSFLEKYVPMVATLIHWTALSVLSLMGLVLLIFVYSGFASWVKEKRKPKQLSREEWEEDWKVWREKRAREKAEAANSTTEGL